MHKDRTVFKNIAQNSCLVCCPKDMFTPEHEELLIASGYTVKTVNSASDTLRSFFDIKPDLLIVHYTFLLSSPQRLLQMFRIAGRTPAVLIMADNAKQIWRYLSLNHDTYIEFIGIPLNSQELAYGVKLAGEMQKNTRQALFYKDFFILGALALPMVSLLLYLLFKG